MFSCTVDKVSLYKRRNFHNSFHDIKFQRRIFWFPPPMFKLTEQRWNFASICGACIGSRPKWYRIQVGSVTAELTCLALPHHLAWFCRPSVKTCHSYPSRLAHGKETFVSCNCCSKFYMWTYVDVCSNGFVSCSSFKGVHNKHVSSFLWLEFSHVSFVILCPSITFRSSVAEGQPPCPGERFFITQ